jgi:hypothetical protein
MIGLSSYSAELQPYYNDATRPTLLCSNLITTQNYVSQHPPLLRKQTHDGIAQLAVPCVSTSIALPSAYVQGS